jgi:hypothetical protein
MEKVTYMHDRLANFYLSIKDFVWWDLIPLFIYEGFFFVIEIRFIILYFLDAHEFWFISL